MELENEGLTGVSNELSFWKEKILEAGTRKYAAEKSSLVAERILINLCSERRGHIIDFKRRVDKVEETKS